MSKPKFIYLAVLAVLAGAPYLAQAEDTDIFVGSPSTFDNPNVLIILDNTSNWSRQSQQWPGGQSQGQSEANAIKTVLGSLGAKGKNINIGLLEFATDPGSNDGGFIRYHIRPMDPATTNVTNFQTQLTTIYNNITDPKEKINSGSAYGNLMYDAYNYFAGANAFAPSASVVATKADSAGYTTNYTKFFSPLSAANSCSKSFIIFISNPTASGPTRDTAANTAALAALGGNTSQLGLPDFTNTSVSTVTPVGTTAQCYSSKTACTTANELSSTCSAFASGCTCDAAVTNVAPVSCSTGTLSYSVIGTTTGAAAHNNVFTVSSSIMGTVSASNAAWSMTLAASANPTPAVNATVTVAGCATASGKTLNGTQVVTASAGSTITFTANKGAPVCGAAGTVTQAIAAVATSTTTLGYTSSCFASAGVCSTADYAAQCSAFTGGCACGSPTAATTASCSAGTSKYTVINTESVLTNVPLATSHIDTQPFNADEWARFLFKKGVPLAGYDNKSITTYTIDVYNAQPNSTHTSLMLGMARAGGGKYFSANNEAAIVDAINEILNEIQSVNSTFASASLPVSATNRAQNLNEVYIGMFRPDADAKPRWFGNMKRYQLAGATDVSLSDVNGVSAVNNQTGFISSCATSFWSNDTGNYWDGMALNPDPVGTCTTSTNSLYSDAPDGPLVEKGGVAQIIRQGNSPPNPSVLVNPPTDKAYTYPSPSYLASGRKVLTNPIAGGALVPLTVANSGSPALSANLVDFLNGKDVWAEKSTDATKVRPSIHGDVIHSRPLPVNYGTTGVNGTGVTVFYGANDGALRAVDGATGKERWAFIAPEFFSRLDRLSTNSPKVSYPPSPVVGSTAKDYFFDGSIGAYQYAGTTTPTITDPRVWIYPTMRRGGRTVYALDVTDANNPAYKWKVGCPNLASDTNCSTNMGDIGQTWSIPQVVLVKGFIPTTPLTTPTPLVMFGGGYDKCEDTDNKITTECDSGKGHYIYLVDGYTGELVRKFATDGSVVADLALVDADRDGYPDYAYAATTRGSIYRVDFVDNSTGAALAKDKWVARKVAYTTGAGRKFLFTPSLTYSSGKVFVALGSGDREAPLITDYPYVDTVKNRFYVYRDTLANAATTAAVNLDDETLMQNSTGAICTTAAVTSTSSKTGWFMDLGGADGTDTGRGEQVVGSSLIFGGLVFFSTNHPLPAATGTCSTSLGVARGYILSLQNGSGTIGVDGFCGGATFTKFAGGGLPPSPVLALDVVLQVGDGTKTVNTVCIGCAQKSGHILPPGSKDGTTCIGDVCTTCIAGVCTPCTDLAVCKQKDACPVAGQVSIAIGGAQQCIDLPAIRKRKFTYQSGN